MKRATAAILLALVSCLPGDNRPEPGSITISAVATEATRLGFTTSDGWTVAFDRVVIAVGDSYLEDDPETPDGCNNYAGNIYNRLFDFTQVGREHVGIVFGLGRCSYGFAIRPPNSDTKLGPGVTTADVQRMRTPAIDGDEWDFGLSVLLRGRAAKDGVEKRFNWDFSGFAVINECSKLEGEGLASVYQLNGGDALDITLEARAQELFRVAPNDEEPFAFDHLAKADLNGDGAITFEELGKVDGPLPTVEPDPEAKPPKLSVLIQLNLAPRIIRVAGTGDCSTDSFDKGGGFGQDEEETN